MDQTVALKSSEWTSIIIFILVSEVQIRSTNRICKEDNSILYKTKISIFVRFINSMKNNPIC